MTDDNKPWREDVKRLAIEALNGVVFNAEVVLGRLNSSVYVDMITETDYIRRLNDCVDMLREMALLRPEKKQEDDELSTEDKRLLGHLEEFWAANNFNGYSEVWNNDGPHIFNMAETTAKEAFLTLNPSTGKRFNVAFRVKPRLNK